jgi:hypothetical protein
MQRIRGLGHEVQKRAGIPPNPMVVFPAIPAICRSENTEKSIQSVPGTIISAGTYIAEYKRSTNAAGRHNRRGFNGQWTSGREERINE